MRPNQKQTWLAMLSVSGALLLSACASVQPEKIAATDLSPGFKHPYTVHVQIEHYANQDHIKDHGLGPAIIIDAVQRSIVASHLFKAVVPASNADYILSMRVNPIHPRFQMGPTVWYMSHINWKLTEVRTKREPYTRNVLYAKAVTAAARGRGVVAQEGAFHGNIRRALWDIGSFNIASETRPMEKYEKGKGDPDQ